MIRSAFACAALFFAACTHSTTVASPAPEKGKPSAPVAVTAQLAQSSARVTVTFEADVKDVVVSVSGVDGLAVAGEATVLQGQAFAKGESRSFDVAYTRPAGRAELVVNVSGDFGGGKRGRVASFVVGEGPLPASPGEVMTTDQGDTVKVMPAAQ
ncbi:MAG: hypothetical protein AB1938_23970 [Myxococcota bacterium]